MKLSEMRKDTVLREAIGSAGWNRKLYDILDASLAKAVSRGTFLLIDGKTKQRQVLFS